MNLFSVSEIPQLNCFFGRVAMVMVTPHSNRDQTNTVSLSVLQPKEIKDILQFSKIASTTCANLWDTMKTGLREKFIASSAYVKNLEKSTISDLTIHLTAQEQKEAHSMRTVDGMK